MIAVVKHPLWHCYLVNVCCQSVIEDNHLLPFTYAGVQKLLVLGCSHIQIYWCFSIRSNTYQGSCIETASKTDKRPSFTQLLRRQRRTAYHLTL